MWIDIVLATLKFLAILSAGVWAAIGALVDFKVDGKVTKWGRRALFGTIASTIVAVATQSIETYKQIADRNAQNDARILQDRRTEATLHEIRRGLFQIKDVQFDAVILLSTPPDEVKAYLNRIKHYLDLNKKFAEPERDDSYVLIEGKSVYPNPTRERIAYTALRKPDLILRIFKDRQKSDCFWKNRLTQQPLIIPESSMQDQHSMNDYVRKHRNRNCEPDLELTSDPPSDDLSSISVGVKDRHVLLYFWSLHAVITDSGDGQIASVADLAGAHLSVELRYGDNDDAWITQSLGGAQIESVSGIRIDAMRLDLEPAKSIQPGFVFNADFAGTEGALWRTSSSQAHP